MKSFVTDAADNSWLRLNVSLFRVFITSCTYRACENRRWGGCDPAHRRHKITSVKELGKLQTPAQLWMAVIGVKVLLWKEGKVETLQSSESFGAEWVKTASLCWNQWFLSTRVDKIFPLSRWVSCSESVNWVSPTRPWGALPACIYEGPALWIVWRLFPAHSGYPARKPSALNNWAHLVRPHV